MTNLMAGVNWPAVFLGTALAFALGMAWFSPRLFGKGWAEGSHGIKPPATPPVAALTLQLLGTFLMAWIVGVTETAQALGLALLVIVAIAVLQLAGALFSQKTWYAAAVDAGYVLAMGVAMILAQVVL